ncbi:MAG: methyltransferase family protein [Promethearchaeota archaeon]
MTDFTIVGPIASVFAFGDVILHLYLDFGKAAARSEVRFQEPRFPPPSGALALAAYATLLAFALVLLIPAAWVLNLGDELFYMMGPIPLPSAPIWMAGILVLVSGILLHGWSRFVRQEMATSWAMSKMHKLITSGPYSRVRHPSYLSYFLCFIGLLMVLPTLISLTLLLGFPGYYSIALAEERHLKDHFGDEYVEYMGRTGRFLPAWP